MGRKLKSLSKSDLEKRKLIAEIKSKVWFRQPSFWTFIVVLVTAGTGFYTGFFKAEKALIKLDNEKLNMRKDDLSSQIDSMENEYVLIKYKYDSLNQVTSKLWNDQDSIKKVYKIWYSKKQSRTKLKKEISSFINLVREKILYQYKDKTDELFDSKNNKAFDHASWLAFNKKTDELSKKYKRLFDSEYKNKAILYKQKALSFLPNYKQKVRYVNFEYPTNFFGIENILDELYFMYEEL